MRDITPLYDAMIRLYIACMGIGQLPAQIMASILAIPYGTFKDILKLCPLPNGAEIWRGGHRGLELIISTENGDCSERDKVISDICMESIWQKYGLVLRPVNQIISEVDKTHCNALTLHKQGPHQVQCKIIREGDPKVYRCLWFVKDNMNCEFFSTVHEAMIKKPSKPPVEKGTRVIPVVSKPIPAGKTVEAAKPYSLKQLVSELTDLLSCKDHYSTIIAQLQDEINNKIPTLLAKKESERAIAVNEATKLRERVKHLEKVNGEQLVEIKNLKRHPKFAGYVRVDKKDPRWQKGSEG